MHIATLCAAFFRRAIIATGFVLVSFPALAQITLSPATLSNGTQGVAYSQAVTASGGTGPYTYAVTSGALPSGLSLNASTGDISGTPTTTGINNFTIRATDSLAATGSRSYSISIGTASLTLLPTSLPGASQGTAYSQTITAVGGNAPYTFTLSSGSLPPGLSLNSNGNLTGTPTAGGSFGFILQASDIDGNTGFRTYSISVAGNSLTINPASLPNGTQGVAYSQTLVASGGVAPYTYSITSGSLPGGLSLNASSGAITGAPTANGTFNFTARAVDSNGDFGTRSYSLTIGGNTLTINPATLPNGMVSVAYSQTVTASGGTAPYTYSISAGSLPTGLSINAGSGAITGTPTAGGTFNFTVRAIDSDSNFGTRSYTVSIGTVSLTVNPASLPAGTVSTPYNQTVSASGGTGPYTFSVTSGSLPAGLSLNASTGAITGTPSAAGSSTFTIQAVDSAANTGSRSYTLNINAVPLTLNPPSLPPGTQGLAYSQTITASGGTAPYTYVVLSGSLPPGLSLNGSSGALTGTPTSGGTYNFTVQATDSTPNTGTRAYTLVIGTNSLTVNPASLPAGTQGVAYNQTVIASGGTGPYTFAVTSGALPAGLSLNASTGAITGTPTGSGLSNFTIRATDSVGNIGSRPYAVNIGTNSLTVNPATLPGGTRGTAYSQTVTATGGTGPYTFSITAGSLPAGLTLNTSTGAISGTPTGSGTSTFTIRAADSIGNFGTRAYTLGIARPDPTLDPNVQGLVASQAATARRFSDAQISNVTRHLEDIHDHFDPCAFSFNVAVVPVDPRPVTLYGDLTMPPPPAGSPAEQVVRRTPTQNCEQRTWQPNVSVWAGGTVEFGSLTPSGLVKQSFTTGGLTLGADARISENVIIGGAFGFGSDRTDISQDSTSSTARAASGMIYGSFRPLQSLFIDAVLGYGGLSFDNRRWVALDSVAVAGTRMGTSWFGSISVSFEVKSNAFKIAPYVRADVMGANLNSYSEQGASIQALTFGAVSFSSTSAVLGVRTYYDMPMSWGVLSPNLRLEYRHALDGGFNQSMYYTDLGSSLTYTLAQSSATRDLIAATIGLRARIGAGGSVDVEFGSSAAGKTLQGETVRATARLAF